MLLAVSNGVISVSSGSTSGGVMLGEGGRGDGDRLVSLIPTSSGLIGVVIPLIELLLGM